ncbi:hypothetical protein ACWC0A_30405 [Streptomyces scopuliridis]
MKAADVATNAISRWLASSIKEPVWAYEDWGRGRPAVLRCGIRFDAIRMPAPLMHAALGTTVPEDVPAALADALTGPVIADHAQWFYALVPVGTCERWREAHSVGRGIGAWLGVPRLDQLGPDGVHWAQPIRRPGRLSEPNDVAALVRKGSACLAGDL